jgi:hypothetical protein
MSNEEKVVSSCPMCGAPIYEVRGEGTARKIEHTCECRHKKTKESSSQGFFKTGMAGYVA